MSRTPEITVLSATAAQTLYDKIASWDKRIDAAQERVLSCNRQIADAVIEARTLHGQRQELARELAVNAENGWVPRSSDGVGVACAPFTPNMRFHRSNPFPPAFPGTGGDNTPTRATPEYDF